jgi:hypothetical protein
MQKNSAFLAIPLTIFSMAAASTSLEQRCGDVMEVMPYAINGIAAENSAFTLQRDGRATYLLFVSRIDPSKGKSSKGQFAPWRLLERQGPSSDYCLVAAGNWMEPLASIHFSKPANKYGMPDSGHSRCSDGDSIQGAIEVRMWANKELGEVMTLHLNSDIGTNDFTFLMANDRAWILLDNERNDAKRVCYRSRGTTAVVRYNVAPQR